MFFSEKNLGFRLLDVIRYRQEHVRCLNHGRHFAAVSFRLESDAELRAGKTCIRMQKGSVSFFPADFCYSRTAEVDDVIAVHLEVYGASPREIESFVTKDYERVRAAFEKLEAGWRARGEGDTYALAACFASLFDLLHRESLENGAAGSTLMEKALGAIHEGFADPDFSVAGLAASLGVSPEYLRRVFRAEQGTSPKAYLQSFRLKRASSLLLSGELTVAEVAEKAGFADEKYFSVAFRRGTGTSPSRYRYAFTEKDLLPGS